MRNAKHGGQHKIMAGILITPGKTFGPTEKITTAKLNALGRPIASLEPGAVGINELDADAVRGIINAPGKNLFCNGDFHVWAADDLGLSASIAGVIAGGRTHDYGGAARWVTTNDANRTASRQVFAVGQTEVPDSPTNFMRWVQSAAPVSAAPYMGQRLEDVAPLSGKTVTLSIWVRATAGLTVQPAVRQYFSGAGSADVVTLGTIVALTANAWQKVTQTFTVPDASGKTIGTPPENTFTEFRIMVQPGISFQVDFAQAMLVLGSSAMVWETRLPHEDLIYAARYYQILGLVLSTNITAWTPFVNLRVRMRKQFGGLVITLVPQTGTGATIGGGYQSSLVQTANHSAVSLAYATIDGELNAAT